MRLFSVVVTTLDFAPFVVRSLESVQSAIDALRQHPGAPDVEVLVVDDGSTDDTPRIAEAFAEGRPGWRFLRRPRPTSPSAARNFGVAQSQGDVLCFLDGDDLSLPAHLWSCWRALGSDFDFVKTGVVLADPVHPDWVPRIEGSLVINLAVRRRCHDAVGGFADLHLFRREGDSFAHEMDIFHKVEDQFYNQSLARRFRGVGVREQTVEYVRRPGNSYDRQLGKFRRPACEASPPGEPRELLRLRLAELLAEGVPPAVPSPAGAAGVESNLSEAWRQSLSGPNAVPPNSQKPAECRTRRGTAAVPMAAGEVLDRLSVLRIKVERIRDESMLAHVQRELTAIEGAARHLLADAEAAALLALLLEVNGRLWDAQDALRDCESAQDFTDRFVELARSLQKLKDDRNTLKRRANEVLGAAWTDQRQYGSA